MFCSTGRHNNMQCDFIEPMQTMKQHLRIQYKPYKQQGKEGKTIYDQLRKLYKPTPVCLSTLLSAFHALPGKCNPVWVAGIGN